VVNVVDGDTVDLSTGEHVRIIGIDTPEQGQCGFDEATYVMASLVLDKQVVVVPGARDDVDQYGRILRYIDVNGVDAGREMIAAGYAIARYDSRDGYGGHTREADYVPLDGSTPQAYGCPPASTVPKAAPVPAPIPARTPAPTAAPVPAPIAAAAPSSSGGCNPNYTGCVPNASDVDCAGGSGNGPAYTGPVQVIGTDVYGLDRDGDGYACE
jgi:hypothetical protein